MTDNKAKEWLKEKGIELEESFVDAIKKLAKNYKQAAGIRNTEEVYSLIGLKKQYLSYWAKNPSSVQQKKLQTKYNFKSCRSF